MTDCRSQLQDIQLLLCQFPASPHIPEDEPVRTIEHLNPTIVLSVCGSDPIQQHLLFVRQDDLWRSNRATLSPNVWRASEPLNDWSLPLGNHWICLNNWGLPLGNRWICFPLRGCPLGGGTAFLVYRLRGSPPIVRNLRNRARRRGPRSHVPLRLWGQRVPSEWLPHITFFVVRGFHPSGFHHPVGDLLEPLSLPVGFATLRTLPGGLAFDLLSPPGGVATITLLTVIAARRLLGCLLIPQRTTYPLRGTLGIVPTWFAPASPALVVDFTLLCPTFALPQLKGCDDSLEFRFV